MRAPLLRRVVPLVIVLAVAATGAVAVASGGAGHSTAAAGHLTAGAGHPTVAASARNGAHRALRLVRRAPATIRGSGFRPRAAVRVTLAAGRRYVSRARTNGAGTFTVRFATVVDRCTAWTVTAVQNAAAPLVVRGPKPECAPASTP